MLNEIQIFENEEFGSVRIIGDSDNPLFCLADVCRILELPQVAKVVQRLEDEVLSKYPIKDSLGRMQETYFVNEDGLYDVILDSRKPAAKKLRKWITSDVLPKLRKTGMYVSKEQMLTPEFLHELADRMEYYQRRLEEEKSRVDDMQVTHDLYKRTTFRVGFPFTMKIVADVVKEIGLGRNKLYEFLREQKILTEKNEPMRQYQECGYFQSCFVEYFDQYIVYVSLSGLKFIFKKLVQAGKISSKIGLDTYIEMSINEIRAYNEE